MTQPEKEKTHFRKAFNSPYLSSADLVGPTILTIKEVRLEKDHSKRTKDSFNTIHFVERDLRRGEKLKPMILNATNSKTMATLSGSQFIEDWAGVAISVYVEQNIKFGKDMVDGLRISPVPPKKEKPFLTPKSEGNWTNAIEAYKRDGNLDEVLKRVQITEENQKLIMEQANVS
jgi:hypothetical protein